MSTANRVWVADDEKSIRWVLDKALSKEGISVTCFESAEALLTEIDSGQPDVVVSDIRMGGMDGLALLSRLREQHPDVPVIVMTAHSDLDSAVASIQGGAFEYIPKPFEVDEAVSIVKRALIEHTRARQTRQHHRSNSQLKSSVRRRRCKRFSEPSAACPSPTSPS